MNIFGPAEPLIFFPLFEREFGDFETNENGSPAFSLLLLLCVRLQ